MKILERIHYVLQEEAKAIQNIEVTEDFEKLVHALMNVEGKIITTGIGKAGYIANKFSATLCSTGTPSVFMHPSEALHGDLGIISPKDVIIAFSTSGKSDEVLSALHLARRIGIEWICGVTSHEDSALREMSDFLLPMGIIEEPCPLQLTPSASLSVMLAISDAIALALMEQKKIECDDFHLRHHGGYLGNKAENLGSQKALPQTTFKPSLKTDANSVQLEAEVSLSEE